MNETQKTVATWARETFGQATNMRAATRANEEMAELLKAFAISEKHPKAPEEMADILICMYRIAENLGVDLHAEVDKKMAINRTRSWERDESGCGYHVEYDDDDADDGPDGIVIGFDEDPARFEVLPEKHPNRGDYGHTHQEKDTGNYFTQCFSCWRLFITEGMHSGGECNLCHAVNKDD